MLLEYQRTMIRYPWYPPFFSPESTSNHHDAPQFVKVCFILFYFFLYFVYLSPSEGLF